MYEVVTVGVTVTVPLQGTLETPGIVQLVAFVLPIVSTLDPPTMMVAGLALIEAVGGVGARGPAARPPPVLHLIRPASAEERTITKTANLTFMGLTTLDFVLPEYKLLMISGLYGEAGRQDENPE